jgi:osmotically-inducible protein OsmY
MDGDTDLRAQVLEELAWEPAIDAAHVGVAAKDGAVTLTGHVRTYAEKHAAEQAARRVKGVRAIAQEIAVTLHPSDTRPDEEIAANGREMLKWNVNVPEDRIALAVERGHVKMTGEVDWQYQKDTAESNVRVIRGVRSIDNLIAVKPRVRDAEVKQKIEAAFKRSAEVDAAKISVSATDGAVALSGHVRTWHEREMARRAAWSAKGVSEVTDNLTIEP